MSPSSRPTVRPAFEMAFEKASVTRRAGTISAPSSRMALRSASIATYSAHNAESAAANTGPRFSTRVAISLTCSAFDRRAATAALRSASASLSLPSSMADLNFRSRGRRHGLGDQLVALRPRLVIFAAVAANATRVALFPALSPERRLREIVLEPSRLCSFACFNSSIFKLLVLENSAPGSR